MQPGINLDWEKLRLFDTVAEAGSFTEAARRLHMSQPALSRQIAALEKHLRVKLITRSTRSARSTASGPPVGSNAMPMMTVWRRNGRCGLMGKR